MGAVLAVRNDRFGEFLLNIPAFRAIKRGFSNARLIVAIDPYVSELIPCIEEIDEVVLWENKRHSVLEIARMAWMLREKKIDCCVILNPSREFHMVSFMAGIPLRAGYNRKCGFLLNKRIEDKKVLALKHEIEYNLDVVKLLGIDSQDTSLSLKIDESASKKVALALGVESFDAMVAVHPWTSDPVKQWPLKNFSELIQKLSQEMKLGVVIVGGAVESKAHPLSLPLDSPRVINTAGKTTLVELAAVLKKCKLLVSADSGPVHLASCVHTPVIALFRNDLPGKGSTRWGPWGEHNFVIEKNNLSDISVSEVAEKVKILIGQRQ